MSDLPPSVGLNSFGLVNDSSNVSEAEAAAMAEACQKQLARDFAPAWNVPALSIKVYPDLAAVPADQGIFVMHLVDQSDTPDDLGYHNPFYGEIEVALIVGNGWGILNPKPGAPPGQGTVSTVASHEFMETLVDPLCNLWIAVPGLAVANAYEVADPVQGSSYSMDGVLVSDFVLPAWFLALGALADPSVQTKFDFMGVLDAPFKIAPGGYLVQENPDGSTTNVYGAAAPPDWRIASARRVHLRHLAGRTRRRRYDLDPNASPTEETNG